MMNSALLQQRANAQYQRVQVETASPSQLVLMLYRGCVRFIGLARTAFEKKDFEASRINLLKAQDILTELMGSLNLEQGGEIAANLMRLYDYMHYRLVEANIKRDDAAAAEVEGLVRSMIPAWEEVLRQHQAAQPQSPSAGAAAAYSSSSRLGAV